MLEKQNPTNFTYFPQLLLDFTEITFQKINLVNIVSTCYE